MKKSLIIALLIILISLAVSVYFYPKMPDQMASHWNFQSKVDGYMPKFLALFLIPLVSLALFLLFIFIPKIDPLKQNIKKFKEYYNFFILMLVLFLFYLDILIILYNLGFGFSMISMLAPAFAILFYYTGILLENSKRNWFIGIRTPWTLSNDKIWDKTHKLGSKLFKISAVISLLGGFLQDYALLFVLVPIILSSIYLFIYSYFVYKSEYKKIK